MTVVIVSISSQHDITQHNTTQHNTTHQIRSDHIEEMNERTNKSAHPYKILTLRERHTQECTPSRILHRLTRTHSCTCGHNQALTDTHHRTEGNHHHIDTEVKSQSQKDALRQTDMDTRSPWGRYALLPWTSHRTESRTSYSPWD